MQLAMIGQEKLWATPSAMDHLPQRSAEATLRLQEGQRKGRSRPSNLREQVDPETMKMYPTPTLSDTEGGIVKNVELNNGSFSRRNKQGVRWGVKLRDAVNHLEQQQMWPTPTTQEIEHPQAELTATGRRKTKDGTNSHSLNLADTVQQMLPTPTERDWKGGHGTLVKKNGKYYRVSNTTGTRFGARLDAVVEKEQETAQEMWPTPRQRDWKDGTSVPPSRIKNPGLMALPQKVISESETQQKQSEIKLHLNPTWVEALMGFPPGWTVLGNEESQE